MDFREKKFNTDPSPTVLLKWKNRLSSRVICRNLQRPKNNRNDGFSLTPLPHWLFNQVSVLKYRLDIDRGTSHEARGSCTFLYFLGWWGRKQSMASSFHQIRFTADFCSSKQFITFRNWTRKMSSYKWDKFYWISVADKQRVPQSRAANKHVAKKFEIQKKFFIPNFYSQKFRIFLQFGGCRAEMRSSKMKFGTRTESSTEIVKLCSIAGTI
jgi:hypothetical protein